MSVKTGNSKSYIKRVVSTVKDNPSVVVEVSRNGKFTIAQAFAFLPCGEDGALVEYHATGATIKYGADKEATNIGERIAASRALHKLSSVILSDTMTDVHQRCQDRNEDPFKAFTMDDLFYFKALAAGEIKGRKAIQARKEAKRKKYVAEAEAKKALDEIEKAVIVVDELKITLTQGEDA